jgi:hypothetical protein
MSTKTDIEIVSTEAATTISLIEDFQPTFIAALTRRINADNSLHDIVKKILIAAGILDKKQSTTGVSQAVEKVDPEKVEETSAIILKWATDAEFNEGWTRRVISNLLTEHHIHRRAEGAGRKTNPQAEAIVGQIDVDEFGGDWEAVSKALIAAARIARQKGAELKKAAKASKTSSGGLTADKIKAIRAEFE